jgi:hypothetical protein
MPQARAAAARNGKCRPVVAGAAGSGFFAVFPPDSRRAGAIARAAGVIRDGPHPFDPVGPMGSFFAGNRLA